jgi:cobalamin biosynthesis protein CobW
VKIVNHGYQDAALTNELLLGFNAAVEDDLESRPSHHDHEEEHDHDDDIDSTYVLLEKSCDPDKLKRQLEAIVLEQEIYRVKGFVAVTNKAMRLVVQGVGQRFEQFYDRPWQTAEPRQTRLVFIGKNLNREQIELQLQAAIA